jgi:hypothetical protein
MNIITNYSQLKLLVELAWRRGEEDLNPSMVIDAWLSQLAEKEQEDENTSVPLSA